MLRQEVDGVPNATTRVDLLEVRGNLARDQLKPTSIPHRPPRLRKLLSPKPQLPSAYLSGYSERHPVSVV